ncbi:MAG: pimeloyl-ACP methyl ester carboxylesterase [Pontimonas sp.]|jgi:pimeloyl-ACP methyl ester carboxylesterase
MRWSELFRVNTAPLLHVAVDEGEGPPVILLHGIASSSVTFTHVVPLLQSDHRVIAMDLLGFGQSPNPPQAHFTLEEHVAAVAGTIKSLRLKGPVTLVGHSLGALIANRYAAENKTRVKHLVMVAPPVYLPGHTILDPLERLQMDAYRHLYDYMQANRSFTTAGAKALSQFSPIKNLLEVTEENWRAFTLSLENCIESQSTVADVSQVSAPIDLVYGTRDFFLSSAGLRVLERMRGVTTTRVEGLDHIVRPRMAEEIVRIVNDPSPATGLIRTLKD